MNAEPLDNYLTQQDKLYAEKFGDALDRAEADNFPPCCAECWFFRKIDGRFVAGVCAKKSTKETIHITYEKNLCKWYEHEPKSPSDGLEDIY